MPKKKIDPTVGVGFRLSSHEKVCAERMNNLIFVLSCAIIYYPIKLVV